MLPTPAPSLRILVLEDDFNIQKLLWVHLRKEGWDVDFVESAEAALDRIRKEHYDLLLLDWMVQGVGSGVDVCRANSGKIPVLMLTSRSDPSDVILGLEMGADDYLTKPFEVQVLIARVKALLRRAQSHERLQQKTTLQLGEIEINTERVEVRVDGEPLDLTPTEFKVLHHLLSHAGKVMTRDALKKRIQEAGIHVTDRVIDTHIYHVRKKLGPSGERIETVRGIGYRVRQ